MRTRLILYVIALVVVPTSILSIMAAIAVRDREMDIQRRLEFTAERTIRTVTATLMSRLDAAQLQVMETMVGAVDEDNMGGVLVAGEGLRRSMSFVDQVFVFNPPDLFVYPPEGKKSEIRGQKTEVRDQKSSAFTKAAAGGEEGKRSTFNDDVGPSLAEGRVSGTPQAAALRMEPDLISGLPIAGGSGDAGRVTSRGVDEDRDGTCDLSILTSARNLEMKEKQFEKAVREYEAALGVTGVAPEVQAEAALGAGRCYRELNEFKFATGAFRQIAGYFESRRATLTQGGGGDQAIRDSEGRLYSLVAMKELIDTCVLASERDAAAASERWTRLAVESELELFERVVFLYQRIVPVQRTDILEFLGASGMLNRASGLPSASSNSVRVVASYERRVAERAGQLLTLLDEQERNEHFLSNERDALLDTATREIQRGNLSRRITWLVVKGVPFAISAGVDDGLGAGREETFNVQASAPDPSSSRSATLLRDEAGSRAIVGDKDDQRSKVYGLSPLVGGFRVNMAGMRRFVHDLANSMSAENGIMIEVENATEEGRETSRPEVSGWVHKGAKAQRIEEESGGLSVAGPMKADGQRAGVRGREGKNEHKLTKETKEEGRFDGHGSEDATVIPHSTCPPASPAQRGAGWLPTDYSREGRRAFHIQPARLPAPHSVGQAGSRPTTVGRAGGRSTLNEGGKSSEQGADSVGPSLAEGRVSGAPQAAALRVEGRVSGVNGSGDVGRMTSRGVEKSEKGLVLASVALRWPFDEVVLRAYAVEPEILKRNRLTRLMLQEWGIAVLAFGVLAGAWVVLRQSVAEMRRLREKSDYVAAISHDLRTPLASMRMLAESLYLDRVEDPARQKQFLGTIIAESRRLGHLAERVLYFVRYGEDALTYQIRKTDVGEVVRETVESFSASMAASVEKPGHLIHTYIEPELPLAMIDPAAISQVVLNLLDNAVKYSKMPQGEREGKKEEKPQVNADLSAPPDSVEGQAGGRGWEDEETGEREETFNVQAGIEVNVVRDSDGWIEISVRDDGPGISRRDAKRIFRKFYRGSGAGKESVPGIGLGLAVCRHIVRGHGGRIDVESEPGQGSRFIIRLPAAEQSV